LDEWLRRFYRSCTLCPRACGVDRLAGERGYCRESATPRIAVIEAHMGEEPPLSGTNGSGTVFFSGCSLRCVYCQNIQISQQGIGRPWSVPSIVARIRTLHQQQGIHNINFVTPDHFFPHTIAVVERLQTLGISLPVVYNVSGYQALSALRLIEPLADIYLPDFKYADASLAENLSRAPDYPEVALTAIAQMVRRKGFLDSCPAGDSAPARAGVLVRHLILPGHIENSLTALDMLYAEFGASLPVSLMAQYSPPRRFADGSPLNRTLTEDEYLLVLERALALGFKHLFAQDLQDLIQGPRLFLPDFGRTRPFCGNPNPAGPTRRPQESSCFGR
jgi:putative pyruvate formate lyase activating enzyme